MMSNNIGKFTIALACEYLRENKDGNDGFK